jgi:endonuclease/exonuclease/phosphatase family metal-dependent hydrolase
MLRVVQYNVRSFRKQSGGSNLEQLSATLRALDADVICLNEVNLSTEPDALATLAQQMGSYHHNYFGHALDGKYGNAIVSRFPVMSHRHVHLRGGAIVSLTTKEGKVTTKEIVRGLLVCEIQIPGNVHSLHVACTHLDHIAPEERLKQVRHLLDVVAALPAESPVLIAGDLNALSRSDFSDIEWRKLQSTYRSRKWDGPFDCASANGCLALLRAKGFEDCGAAQATQRAPQPTSVGLNVRIDYIHVCRRFQQQLGNVSASRVLVSPITADLSDHYPVIVDFGRANNGSSKL